MKQSPTKDKGSKDEANEKKKTIRYAVIFISVVIVVFSVVWFGGEWMASESVISTTTVSMNGKERLLQLSEKRSGRSRNYQGTAGESGIKHYAYYLELIDPVSKAILSKVCFKAPVLNIQNTPSMIIADEIVWVVSTTNSSDRDRQGFVLKFSLTEQSIQPMDFILDDKFRVRKVEGDKVYLTQGQDAYVSNQSHYYLDLKTGKIEDNRIR